MSSSSVTSQFTIGDLRGNPRRIRKERGMRLLLLVAAATSIVISALIVYTLFKEAWHFLVLLSDESGLGALIDDGANPGWYPRNGRFDLPTIVIGTVLVSLVSIVVAAPLGLGAAVFLSEYASPRTRKWLKPILEVLAGVPSVVFSRITLRNSTVSASLREVPNGVLPGLRRSSSC